MFKSIESFTGTDPNAGVALEAIKGKVRKSCDASVLNPLWRECVQQI
jgi:hypothetical protein